MKGLSDFIHTDKYSHSHSHPRAVHSPNAPCFSLREETGGDTPTHCSTSSTWSVGLNQTLLERSGFNSGIGSFSFSLSSVLT